MAVPKIVEQLKRKRNQLGLSRSLIARLLKLPENSVRRWEHGKHQPSIYYRDKIRKLLGVIEEIQEKHKKGEK